MDDDVILCRCMEITRGEIIRAIRNHDLKSLAAIKRRTTVGMGHCQGRTCAKLINDILRNEFKMDPERIEQATARPPIRLLTIDELGGEAGAGFGG